MYAIVTFLKPVKMLLMSSPMVRSSGFSSFNLDTSQVATASPHAFWSSVASSSLLVKVVKASSIGLQPVHRQRLPYKVNKSIVVAEQIKLKSHFYIENPHFLSYSLIPSQQKLLLILNLLGVFGFLKNLHEYQTLYDIILWNKSLVMDTFFLFCYFVCFTC